MILVSKEFAEIKGEDHCESPFEYSPYSTVRTISRVLRTVIGLSHNLAMNRIDNY